MNYVYFRKHQTTMMSNFGKPPPPLSKRVFNKYDKDNNGYIAVSELQHMMYDLGHPLDSADLTHAAQVLDKDGNGEISYDEFKDWWNKADRYEVLKDVHNNIDKSIRNGWK